MERLTLITHKRLIMQELSQLGACRPQPLILHRCHGRASHSRTIRLEGRILQAEEAACAALAAHRYERKLLQLALVTVLSLACARQEEHGQRCTAACTGIWAPICLEHPFDSQSFYQDSC